MERRRQVPPLTPRLRRVSLIEDYALIGDLQTAALVSREGSIDWCCFPRFDSGACFASILGSPDNGRWLLAPATDVRSTSRRYRHDTLVLETVYETGQGTVRAIDFMPPRGHAPDIVRIVEGLSGSVPMRFELVIRFDYGRIVPWVRRVDDVLLAVAGADALCLWSPVETHGEDMTTVAEFTVAEGERLGFVLTWFPSHEPMPRRRRRRARARRERGVLAGLGRDTHERRRLPRGDQRVPGGVEGDDVRADRRHRGGPDHITSRSDRR